MADPLRSQSVDPLAAQRLLESDLLAALSLLPPLNFSRRLISTSAPTGPIHGSVSTADVVSAIREFGPVLEDNLLTSVGFVEGQAGLEKGRVKATGVYDFEVVFKVTGERAVLKVDVAREE